MISGLAGKQIVNTRAQHQAAEFDALIRARGGVPVSYPCIAIEPPADPINLDKALRALIEGEFDWLVLTSANTVWSIKQRLEALNLALLENPPFRTAVIGTSTEYAARTQLGGHSDLIPDEFIADSLADTLLSQSGKRILLPLSAIAQPALAQKLIEGGKEVQVMDAYHTVRGHGGDDIPALLATNAIHAVTFTSSSTVTYFMERIGDAGVGINYLRDVCIACIGPNTSKTASNLGLTVNVEAQNHTLEGLLDSLETYFQLHGAHL